jgi:hypothetical protein
MEKANPELEFIDRNNNPEDGKSKNQEEVELEWIYDDMAMGEEEFTGEETK